MSQSPTLRLVLLRHGKAASPGWAAGDHARPLTEVGIVQVRSIAALLAELQWWPERVISSTASRAQTTAHTLTAALAQARTGAGGAMAVQLKDELYECGFGAVQDAVAAVPTTVRTLVLVGHNPTFSSAASALCGDMVGLSTANAALLTRAHGSWADVTALGEWTLDRTSVV
jgi:phosphohistidine phosphatase